MRNPSITERFRAVHQTKWKCKFCTYGKIRPKDCQDCKKANQRRAAVLEWMKQRGMLEEVAV